MQQHDDTPPQLIQAVARRLVPVRGPSGKVWGMLDPQTLVIEFKHGRLEERIDLTQYRSEPRPQS